MGKKSFVKKFADTVANVGLQVATYGLVGYDGDKGGIKKGLVTQYGDEAIGEITGRNMARGAANKAADRLAAEDAQAKLDLQNQQLQNYRSDLMASRTAQGLRDTSAARANGGPAAAANESPGSNKLGGGDEGLLGV